MQSAIARLTILAVIAICLSSCATRPVTPALARADPDQGYRWSPRSNLPDNDPSTLLILTFSGGGTRAAAFSYGVLEELRRTLVHTAQGDHSMLSEIDLMTSTSGGSFTALAYALYGERLFDVYENAFLKRDVQGALLQRLFNPFNWPRTLSSEFGRSELAEEYYDEILFHNATFADLIEKSTPRAIVGATDVTTGLRVNFWQDQFDWFCSDLSGMHLARAAAASSAVPVVLSPVTIDNRGGTCGYRGPEWAIGASTSAHGLWWPTRADLRMREIELLSDSRERPYLHLVDGGLSDNLGLYGIVQAMQELMANAKYRAAEHIGALRRIAVIIVNARSEPRFDFDKQPSGPGAFDLLMQSVSVPMGRYSTESIAALQDMIVEWRQSVELAENAKRLGRPTPGTPLPPIEFSVIDVSFDAVADPERRSYLQNLPTSFVLPDEAVDRLRDSAAMLLRSSPAFRAFVESLERRGDNRTAPQD